LSGDDLEGTGNFFHIFTEREVEKYVPHTSEGIMDALIDSEVPF